jgi:formylglycine-generating enzyme required for sulfatase activity
VQQQAISGDGAWVYRTFTLAAGTHQIRWSYTKDSGDASFDDAGYLDDLVIVDAYKDLQVTLAEAVVTGSSTLDFGSVQQSSAAVARSLTLKNNGTIPLAITATIPSNSGFAFSTGLLTRSFTINAGQQTALDMKMLTATGGQKTALLGLVATGSLTAPPAVTLSGFIQPTAPVIACSWSGGDLTSGQSTAVDFGTAPSDVTFTVANTGTGVLSLSTVTVSPAANFQVTSQPASTVGINGSTTFTVRALDANRGNHLATVTVTSDAYNAPSFTIPVTSQSTPNIACSWSGGALTSGQSTAVDFGTAPSDVTFTVANTGTGPLSLSTVTVSPAANFQVTSQPASTVGINGTTTFTVRALDANRGNHLATVTVTSDAPNAPSFTIPVTSQSTPNIACSWSGGDLTSGQSTAVDFGTAPSDVTFTVANTGTGVMSLSTVTVSPAANFQVTSQPASTVVINGTTTFTVRALDANRGNHLATVTVVSDAPNAPSFTIPVTSQSTPNIACSWSGGDLTSGQSTAVDFGTAPSDVTFTVANTGTGVLSLSTVTVSPEANFQVTSQPASTVGINGTTTFTVRALDANRGNHLATVTVTSDAPNAPSFTIPVASRVLLAVAGTGAVDGSLVNTGTAALWDMASTVLADGSTGLAMKTGTTPNSGNSTFGATFEGPGILSWNWKVSAQQNYDWLLCEVNGVEVAGISTKTAAWQSQVLQIPAGSQVRWIYRKDAANSSGTDSGHLADIRFSKFATAQSSFDTWSAAHGGLAPAQVLPKGGMQAMFAWLGGVDPTTGPAVGTYQPTVSSGIYQYRYRVDKEAGGMTQPQVSTDLLNWDSRRMKQTLISEDSTSAVIELSVAATGKTFSRLAANVPVYTVPAPTGFVYVAAGTLPSSSGLSGQSVAAFYIAKTETTWGQWQSVRTYAAANGYDIGSAGAGNGTEYPVTNVSWYQVVKWCNARSEQEGLTPVYRVNGSVYKTGESAPTVDAAANGYCLPTEAEWEFAARGGLSMQNNEYSGSNDINAVAWYRDNSGNATHAVGTKQANELGVSDMSGNVWEWCESWYPGYEGSQRVYRGGGWNDYINVAYRNVYYPSYSYNNLGFRVVRRSGQ